MGQDDKVAGMKHDEGKMPWHIVLGPMQAVLDYGDAKYAPGNWRRVPGLRWRYFDAALRHMLKWFGGEWADKESRLPHLAHAMVSLLFLFVWEIEQTPATSPWEENNT